MNIGINGRFLLHPYTGIGQYTIQLLREFSRLAEASKHTFFVVVPDSEAMVNLMEYGLHRGVSHIHFVILPELSIGTAGMRKQYWEQIQVPRFFLKMKVDIAFFPYPSMPWKSFFTSPRGFLHGALRRKKMRIVETVHDTIPWTDPTYRQGRLSAMAHHMAKKALSFADHIVTVSHASQAAIESACDIPASRVSVIYNAADDPFFADGDETIDAETLQKFGLTRGKYFLYAGGYDARKHVRDLVRSFLAHAPHAFTLVLAGGKLYDNGLYGDFDLDYEENPLAKPLTEAQKGASMRVVRTGFLKDRALAALYRGARAFVHFSAAEGFNIPALQALAAGTPLMISDLAVHREIAGECAMYVPLDCEWHHAEMKAAWKRLCEDDALLERLASEGRERAKTFSWEKSARQHLKLFEQLGA